MPRRCEKRENFASLNRRKVEGMEIWWMNESSKAASRESNLKIEFKLCGKAAEKERVEKSTAFEINLIFPIAFSRFREACCVQASRGV